MFPLVLLCVQVPSSVGGYANRVRAVQEHPVVLPEGNLIVWLPQHRRVCGDPRHWQGSGVDSTHVRRVA